MLAPSALSSQPQYRYLSRFNLSQYSIQFQEIIDELESSKNWLPSYARFAREWNRIHPSKKIPTGTSWPDSVFWVYGIKRELEALEELFSIKLNHRKIWITTAEENIGITDEDLLSDEDDGWIQEASRKEAIEWDKRSVQIITDVILSQKISPKERETYSQFETYFKNQFWEDWRDFIPKITELECYEIRGVYKILQRYRERMSKISGTKKYQKVIDLIIDFEFLIA